MRKQAIPTLDLKCKGTGVHIEIDDYGEIHDGVDAPGLAHRHLYNEIIWVRGPLDGMPHDCKHVVDCEEYHMESNTVLFIFGGQMHRFEDEDVGYRGSVIKFSDHFFTDGSFGEGSFLKYNLFDVFASNPFIRLSDGAAAILEGIEAQMCRELAKSDRFGHNEYLKSLLNLFLIEVWRDGGKGACPNVKTIDIEHSRFLRMKSLLEQNYCRVHTVREYADMMGISNRTLNDIIRRNAGCSPLEFIHERIMIEARRMLLHTDHSVGEISDRLGFSHASYFVNFFKKLEGCTPSDLRIGS